MKFKIKPAALTMVVLILFAFTACEDGGTGDSGPTTYEIGDIGPSGEGIVFYISDDDGLHGMEVAPYDQSTFALWFIDNGADGLLGFTTSTGVGQGVSNTAGIIGNTHHNGSAAQMCIDCRTGGLNDWFLPSIDELSLVWENLVEDGGVHNIERCNFSDSGYFSSSLGDYGKISCVNLSNGDTFLRNKLDEHARVRAVRSF